MARRKLTEHQCPRCGGQIPNDEQPGAYPGAISRLDNETEICSACGRDEALSQVRQLGGAGISGFEDWWVNKGTTGGKG